LPSETVAWYAPAHDLRAPATAPKKRKTVAEARPVKVLAAALVVWAVVTGALLPPTPGQGGNADGREKARIDEHTSQHRPQGELPERVAITSGCPTSTPDRQGKARDNVRKAKARQRWWKLRESEVSAAWWTVGGTLGVGIIGAVLLFFTLGATRKAARASADQVIELRKSMVLDQRPWVGPAKITIRKYADAPEDSVFSAPFLIRLDLQNTGKTPAQNVTIIAACGLDRGEWRLGESKPPLTPGPVPWEAIGALAPNVRHSYWMPSEQTDRESLRSLAEGSAYYAVWGMIGYTDQFKTFYWTSFYWWRPGPRVDVSFCATGPYNQYT
jgi:hypothetical protein